MTLPYAPRVAKLTITTTIRGPRTKGINHNIAGPSSSSPARRLSLVPATACPCGEDISGSIPSSYQTVKLSFGAVVPLARSYRRCGRTAGAVVPPVGSYQSRRLRKAKPRCQAPTGPRHRSRKRTRTLQLRCSVRQLVSPYHRRALRSTECSRQDRPEIGSCREGPSRPQVIEAEFVQDAP